MVGSFFAVVKVKHIGDKLRIEERSMRPLYSLTVLLFSLVAQVNLQVGIDAIHIFVGKGNAMFCSTGKQHQPRHLEALPKALPDIPGIFLDILARKKV